MASFQNNGKLKLLIIVGTRPEIIRLAAVVSYTHLLMLAMILFSMAVFRTELGKLVGKIMKR